MSKGFFTDTTVCIGCKACEVACKQWNQLPDDGFVFTAMSYDNTGALGASTWRHVAFIETGGGTAPMTIPNGADDGGPAADKFRWLFSSDVCKHCQRAGCLEACPTGAIIRTEFDTVYVQSDVCNGCGYCVVACPFGVIDRREDDGRAWKCTLCYDRLKGDLEPACAKACPTDSITFGEITDLRQLAQRRLAALHARGETSAYLYGADAASQPGTQGLNAFFLLTAEPEAYNLPPEPVVPTMLAKEAWTSLGAALFGLAALSLLAVAAGARR
jgi:formate dehydrogenase iron-sulfur subunit